MNFFLQVAPQAAPQVENLSTGLMSMLPMLAIFFFFMWFIDNRTQKKQEKKHQEMLNAIKKGDKIVTIGGIIGKVTKATEDKIEIQVDDTTKTKITFQRRAVHNVLNKNEDAETEDKKA